MTRQCKRGRQQTRQRESGAPERGSIDRGSRAYLRAAPVFGSGDLLLIPRQQVRDASAALARTRSRRARSRVRRSTRPDCRRRGADRRCGSGSRSCGGRGGPAQSCVHEGFSGGRPAFARRGAQRNRTCTGQRILGRAPLRKLLYGGVLAAREGREGLSRFVSRPRGRSRMSLFLIHADQQPLFGGRSCKGELTPASSTRPAQIDATLRTFPGFVAMADLCALVSRSNDASCSSAAR